MKTLKFEGHSDDTFGEYAVTHEDIDNCASLKPIQCLITSSDGAMLIVGQYSSNHISDCWVIGISMANDKTPLPEWPIRFKTAASGYSPVLEVDVPDDFGLTWYSDGRED